MSSQPVEAQTVKMVGMRDGIRLATAIYLPADTADGPVPVVLCRNPYGKGPGGSLQDSLFARGIGYLSQDTRGRGDSGGVDSLFLDDGWGYKRDGYDTVEWIAAQPWSDGKIGVVGGSAFGITAYLCAASNPPHLVCGFVLHCASDLYDHAVFPGGCYRKEQVDSWTILNGLGYMRSLMEQNAVYNKFWQRVDIGTRLDSITVPFYHVAGWYDTFCEGNIEAFRDFQHEGAAGSAGNQKLLVGPWTHGNWLARLQGELRYPENSVWNHEFEALRWFDAHLKGVQNGIMDEPPVTAYFMAACDDDPGDYGNHWQQFSDWPPENSVKDTLFLKPNASLSLSRPVSQDSAAEYTYDPARPLLCWGGRNLIWPAGPRNQILQDIGEQNVLWTGEPVDAAMTLAGPVQARLFFSSDRIDTDVMVRLEDVYPDGRSILITDGGLRLRFRNGREHEHFLTPGQITEAMVDLGNIAYTLEPEHALRVAVSSSLFPRYDKNYNTGEPFRSETDTLIAHNRIHVNRDHPSSLILTVLNQNSSIPGEDNDAPDCFLLFQNFPNPFNNRTEFRFHVNTSGMVNLSLYNVRGERIAELVNEFHHPGGYGAVWNADAFASGLYIAVLRQGISKEIVKCMLIK